MRWQFVIVVQIASTLTILYMLYVIRKLSKDNTYWHAKAMAADWLAHELLDRNTDLRCDVCGNRIVERTTVACSRRPDGALHVQHVSHGKPSWVLDANTERR